MGKGTLTIYSASAGSGKTFTLAAVYLSHIFRSRYNYRKILAVTFTNKATAEMKYRILDNLHKLAVGEHSEYLDILSKSTGKSEEWIRKEAKEILHSILHDFSRFNVSTIDSFFQKILRSFTREAGLNAGYNILIDHSYILSTAVSNMISSADRDIVLKNWLTTYALSNIDDEKSWNLKNEIYDLSGELFNEKFKMLSVDDKAKLEDKKFLLSYIKKLREKSFSFTETMTEFGRKAEDLFMKYDLKDDMFYRKKQGIPGYVKYLVSGNIKEPNSYVREILAEPPRWSTGKTDPELQSALDAGLERIIIGAIKFYYENIINYKSSEAILDNIYALGILSDVLHNIRLITSSENSFLLSDSNELLNMIVKADQSPFIYEKVGNRYENYMIDEFQDTSTVQWSNFNPLIENSMGEGFDNLVVGDVKQSIYRWRNGNWQILGSDLVKLIDNNRFLSKPLTTNWRSRSNLIRFNNDLFSIVPEQIDREFESDRVNVSFKELYAEAVQEDQGKKEGGYIKLEFLESNGEIAWTEDVLEKLPEIIKNFQDRGYSASDIGIIVRRSREGAMVLKKLTDYSSNMTDHEKASYNFNVISNDSLLISNAPVIKFILAVINVLNDPSDMISRAVMLRYFLLQKGDSEADKISLMSECIVEESGRFFPADYEAFLLKIRNVTIFEATERIIKFFGLGDNEWNVVYLDSFQDCVLNFSKSKNADIKTFLEWWSVNGGNKSVALPENQDAIRVITIHKSKGLEFNIVILPFISWEMDHMPSKQPILWVKPDLPPFDEIGIVPVKYKKDLSGTIFENEYVAEKQSIFLDNINLLYVAFTRAKDAIYGFSATGSRYDRSIASVLYKAITSDSRNENGDKISLCDFYDIEKKIFEYGQIPENWSMKAEKKDQLKADYLVCDEPVTLKMKFHGENYFNADDQDAGNRISYGNLMHEIFQNINTPGDIPISIKRLVIEGKLPEKEAGVIEKRINEMITVPKVKEWFGAENKIVTEASIILPKGEVKRPDRIIFRDDKTIVVDLKFGEEDYHHKKQVEQYRILLEEMGYRNVEAHIWYADKNKVISL